MNDVDNPVSPDQLKYYVKISALHFAIRSFWNMSSSSLFLRSLTIYPAALNHARSIAADVAGMHYR